MGSGGALQSECGAFRHTMPKKERASGASDEGASGSERIGGEWVEGDFWGED